MDTFNSTAYPTSPPLLIDFQGMNLVDLNIRKHNVYECSGQFVLHYTCFNLWSAFIAPRLVYSLSIEFILGSWIHGQCFKDSSNRVLDATSKVDRSNMTIEKCLEFCLNGGYTFAGVESEDECYCGNNAPSQNPIAYSECNSKCSGDSTQICGGHWKISICRLVFLKG